MSLTYADSFPGDTDLVRCVRSLRLEDPPAQNASPANPHQNRNPDRAQKIIDISSSDEDDNPISQSNGATQNSPLPSSHKNKNPNYTPKIIDISSGDDDDDDDTVSKSKSATRIHYPNDPVHWVEYKPVDIRRARGRHSHHRGRSSGSTDEYPNSDVERQIAALDLQTLDNPVIVVPNESIYNVPVGLETGVLQSWYVTADR
jgi:hypothetical protein